MSTDEIAAVAAAGEKFGLGLGAGPVNAYAKLSGTNRAAVLQQDAAVAQLKAYRAPSDPNHAKLLEAFIRSPMTGMTTLLDLARAKVEYNPLAPRSDEKARKWIMFGMEVAKSPLFAVSSFNEGFDLPPGKPAETAVQKFIGNDPVPAERVRKQIAEVLNRAVSNLGERQSNTVLEEYSLSADATYRFLSMHCAVNAMVVMLPPMNYITEAHGYKGGFQFTFRHELWPKYAEEILNRHVKTVTDWLDENGNIG